MNVDGLDTCQYLQYLKPIFVIIWNPEPSNYGRVWIFVQRERLETIFIFLHDQ